jgi:hypothetical protein
MKKQIPILFSTSMVQAILEGRKTQTRRVIKDLVIDEESGSTYYLKHKVAFDIHNWKEDILRYCPYGIAEDLLWVRETTKVGSWNHEEFKVAYDYKASPELTKTPWCEFEDIGAFDDLLARLMDKLDELGVEPATVDEDNDQGKAHLSGHRLFTCQRLQLAFGLRLFRSGSNGYIISPRMISRQRAFKYLLIMAKCVGYWEKITVQWTLCPKIKVHGPPITFFSLTGPSSGVR